ncbi:MAG: septum formation inhibitor [Bacteroidales bacterium]|nr:septum formation inhibitor [Bacteroidales bacterium]
MIKTFLNKILHLIRNKYFLSFLVFMIWIAIFDQHNLLDRIKTHRHLIQLRKDTLFYHNKIKANHTLIRELKTSDQNLEKFAREQYLMKAPDEDVFVILKKSEIEKEDKVR